MNSAAFQVTVEAANQAPSIAPIAPQKVSVNQTVTTTVNATDPDGDALTFSATSNNPNVATASIDPAGIVTLTGIAEGVATVTVEVNDGRGGTNSAAFEVTAEAIPAAQPTEVAGFDPQTVPELPDLVALEQPLRNGFGLLPVAPGGPNNFAIVGNTLISQEQFITPIANGNYNLAEQAALQTVIDSYNFNVQLIAANPDWTIETLFDPAAVANDARCNAGETPLDCELRVKQPVVIFVNFTSGSVTSVAPDVFRANLERVVDTALNNGTVPILMLVPPGGNISARALQVYNEIIFETATAHPAHPDIDVPLWNTLQTVAPVRQNVDMAAPAGPTDFSAPSLNFGVNRLNLTALELMQRFLTVFSD